MSLLRSLSNCCRCKWVAERTFRDGEPEEERRNKRFMVPLSFWLLPLLVWCIRDAAVRPTSTSASVVAWALATAACGGPVAVALFTHRLPLPVIDTSVATSAAAILLQDWASAATAGLGVARAWQIQVVVMDTALVAQARGVTTQAIAT
eukprot:gene29436-49231_t